MRKTYKCSKCKNVFESIEKGSHFGNYAIFKKKKICLNCAKEYELKDLKTDKKHTFYFYQNKITNFPSTIVFNPTYTRKGKHYSPISGYMNCVFVWFTDHFGQKWIGKQIGENNDFLHCKKLLNKRYISIR